MKNIKSYSGDCFTFHKNVIEAKKITKKDPNYKVRVSALNLDIEKKFEEYTEKFITNTLEEISSIGYNGSNKEDLLNLYNFRSKLLQKLKLELTTDDNNRINNTCQYCTIGEVNSFDHYLPQTEFSEYIVNPLNLIPSCTKCNGYKGSTWRIYGRRIFLNLYLDQLPEIQYLFVKVSVRENEIDLEYFLDARNGVSNEMFELLSYHYDKLHLFKRFKENSDIIISELDTEISKYSQKLSINDIKKTILEECQASYKTLGRNNWKIVLKMALIDNSEYLNRFNK